MTGPLPGPGPFLSRADLPGAGLEPARGLPQGIFIPLQLSLLHTSRAFVVWTLPLPSRDHSLILRSEEHTSELQSQSNLVCRLLLEKKKKHPFSSAIDRGDVRLD